MLRASPVSLAMRSVRLVAVVLVAGAAGRWFNPEPAAASGGECGWECKGLSCKQDPNYPDITCEEEVPGKVCTNSECQITHS